MLVLNLTFCYQVLTLYINIDSFTVLSLIIRLLDKPFLLSLVTNVSLTKITKSVFAQSQFRGFLIQANL